MSAPKHTPAPWTVMSFCQPSSYGEVKPTDAGLYEIEEANEQINGLLAGDRAEQAEQVGEANARLIAAAPDYDSAARKARRIMAECGQPDGGLCPECTARIDEALGAVIAKAEGSR